MFTVAAAEKNEKKKSESRGAQDQSELDQPRALPQPLTEPPPWPRREPAVACGRGRSPDPGFEAQRGQSPDPGPEARRG
jgi:hypothetical protein